MAEFKFTFLLYVSLVLALAASSNANTSGSHRRSHADLGRLLKKRTPIHILDNQPSAQGSPTLSTFPVPVQPSEATPTVAQTTPANSVSPQKTSEAASVSASAGPSTVSGGGLSGTGGLASTESGTASAAVPTTATPAQSSSPSDPHTSAEANKSPAATPTQSILYLTASGAPTATQTSSTSSSSGMSHAALTVLIVIAASVGAAIIVWTIIRKWKFRPSSDFEGRMQPIDWQPGGSDEDPGFPGKHRPLSRASSFHSGSGHGLADDQTREPVGTYDAPALNPIPDHDFTAGAAHLAPVGGYADLARGPSPQPMMQEPLGQAPSINRPIQYDQYGVPLHHGYSGY